MHISAGKKAVWQNIKKILWSALLAGLFLFFICHPSFYTKVVENEGLKLTSYYKKRMLFAAVGTAFGIVLIWKGSRLSEKQTRWAAAALFLATPLFCVFTLEYSNIMKNRFLWQVITGLGIKKFAASVLALAMLLFCLLIITNSYRWSAFLLSLVICVFGVANYFVYSLRGIPILASDLTIAETALNVAGDYEYRLNYSAFSLIFTTVLWYLLLAWPGKVKVMKKKMRFVGIAAMVLVAGIFMRTFIYSKVFSVSLNTCNPHKSYKGNGSVLTFIRSIQLMIVEKPEGYSVAKAEEIAADYPGGGEDNTPNVIIVMDEAFTDLQALSYFETSEDPVPFYHSLKENAIKGQMYVSSFGGKTANTEFEVLTGNSIAFLPPSATPYQIFVKSELPNLNTALKNLGYDNTVGMHPFKATSYNRKLVYKLFGFDKQLFIDDFDEAGTARGTRHLISDDADIDRVIQEYEEARKAGDAPFFIHNVTMQNHSPYEDDPGTLGDIITAEAKYSYSDVETFLTLMHKSDEALEKLVSYFEKVEEPTVILFFGDHQPGLNDEFYTKLLGKSTEALSDEQLMEKYHTPYVIWANYDIEEKEMDISSNYLASIMKEAVGIRLSGYDQFLLKLREELPVLSLNGYWDKNGMFYKVEDDSSPYYEKIQEYNILQYNNMFDGDHRLENFFD